MSEFRMLGSMVWLVLSKLGQELQKATEEEENYIKGHYLKFMFILSPYPPKVFKLGIPIAPGLHAIVNFNEELDKEIRTITMPRDGEFDFIKLINEYIKLVSKSIEINENKTIKLLKEFLFTTWELRTLDISLDFLHYAEIFDYKRLKEILLDYKNDYLLEIAQKKRPVYNPFSDKKMLKFLRELEVARQGLLSRPFKYEKECQVFHQQIKNIYESYRYIVGLFLGLFDILRGKPLKSPRLYFLKDYSTADGIIEFYKGISARKAKMKKGAFTLEKQLKEKFPILVQFFVETLYNFIRPIRNAEGHHIPETPQNELNQERYHVQWKNFDETFTLDELRYILEDLQFLFRQFFGITLAKFHPTILWDIIAKLPIQKINYPFIDVL